MPACLPDSATDYDAVTALVTGWGTISSGGGQPLVLHEADVTTRSLDVVVSHIFTKTMLVSGPMLSASSRRPCTTPARSQTT